MLYVQGGNSDTPRKKVTNKGGKTTIVQDPSNHYKGPDLNKVNVTTKTTPKSAPVQQTSTQSYNPAPAPAPVQESYESYDSGDNGGGSSEPAFDWAAYFAELARQKQERADAAYKRNMESIQKAYDSAFSSLKENYDSTNSRIDAARSNSMSDVSTDAEKSLRQAYINNMLTKKNLNQRLSAMGYNGGATESTMASLENEYGNSRSGINQTLNNNISNLDMSYGNNMADALQSYNTAKANLDLQKMNLEMEAEARRQAAEESFESSLMGLMGTDSSYLTALQNALASQNNYSYDTSRATNSYVPGNAQQAASALSGSNYQKWLQQALLDASNGKSTSEIRNNLFGARSSGQIDADSLYSILKQLGIY